MTDRAGDLLAIRLAQMRDPAAAVSRSIENGWQGVFDDDKPANGKPRGPTYGERSDNTFDAFTAKLAVQPFGS
jgi:hypothetical protein